MITMNRSRVMPASAEQIFEVLSDPNRLATILPRIQSIETLERHSDHARLATHMAIGNGFGTIRCEGDLHWIAPHSIVFTVQKPVSVENQWLLKAVPGGTEVLVTMSLDLTPMLGPFAQFVPTVAVSDMLGRDLDTTLNQIAGSLANDLKQHAVAA